MRSLVSFLLVVMLAACPYFCRADSSACCVDRCGGKGLPDSGSENPACPDYEAVSCICAGAIKDTTRLSQSDDGPVCLGLDFLAHDLFPSLLSPIPGLDRERAPRGSVPSGPSRLHISLLTLRC